MKKKVELLEKRIDNPVTSKRVSLDTVDKLTGVEFEEFLGELFTKMGYRVETTKTTGDQGVDLLVFKNNECIAIQAKRYKSSIGNDAVQQVVAGMRYYKANKSMVITNNYYTESAKKLAESTNTVLWDRDKLSDMIKLLF